MATVTETPERDPETNEDSSALVPPYFAFQTLLNQFDQHPIVAKAPFLGDSLNLLGQP